VKRPEAAGLPQNGGDPARMMFAFTASGQHVTHVVHNDDVITFAGFHNAARHEPAARRGGVAALGVRSSCRWRPPAGVRVRVEVDSLLDADGRQEEARLAPPSDRHGY